jgi:hypothetical protein
MLPPFLKHDVKNRSSSSSPSSSNNNNNTATVTCSEYIPKHRKPSQSHIHQPEMLSLDLGTTTKNKPFYQKDKKYNTTNRRSLFLLYHQQSKWLKLFLIVVGLLFIFCYIPFFRFVKNTPDTHPSWKISKDSSSSSKTPIHVERDQIILYRIIGNDLPPRHKEGQTLSNLQFILDHEPSFPNTRKIFLLNRIIDPINEATIIRLLDSYHMDYLRVPFDQTEYEQLDFQLEKFPDADFLHSDDYRRFSKVSKLRALDYTYHVKNLYAMNNVSFYY